MISGESAVNRPWVNEKPPAAAAAGGSYSFLYLLYRIHNRLESLRVVHRQVC